MLRVYTALQVARGTSFAYIQLHSPSFWVGYTTWGVWVCAADGCAVGCTASRAILTSWCRVDRALRLGVAVNGDSRPGKDAADRVAEGGPSHSQPPKLLDRLGQAIRVRHYSPRTEVVYR
jgi:hypothetical protein